LPAWVTDVSFSRQKVALVVRDTRNWSPVRIAEAPQGRGRLQGSTFCNGYSQTSVHERLRSWTIRFTNKFSEHKASRMRYCVSSYEHASRQHRGAISWENQDFTSSPPFTYAVNCPPYRYGKTKLSFRLYLICLVLCLSFCDRFNGLHWFCVKNLCTKYCCKSLNNHLGSRNGLIHFTLILMGKIVSVYEHFSLITFRFTNDLQERIQIVNRGLTVLVTDRLSVPLKQRWDTADSTITRKWKFFFVNGLKCKSNFSSTEYLNMCRNGLDASNWSVVK